MSGTVNIARSIWTDTAFKPQPLTEREAFMWMIMEASYVESRERRVGNAVVEVRRAQLACSIRFMADAWVWQKSTVDRFLKRLENRDMVTVESGTGINVITICNYDKYQGSQRNTGTAKKIRRDSSGTAAGQQRDKPNKELLKEVKRKQAAAAAPQENPTLNSIPPELIDPTERDQILSAIGVGTDGITGPNCHMIGTPVDMAEYRKWRSDPINLSLADVLAVIGGIMVRRRAKGSGPPGRFSYFSEAMAELSAARAGKITMPTAMRSTASSEEEKKLARWAAIAARGKTA